MAKEACQPDTMPLACLVSLRSWERRFPKQTKMKALKNKMVTQLESTSQILAVKLMAAKIQKQDATVNNMISRARVETKTLAAGWRRLRTTSQTLLGSAEEATSEEGNKVS